MGSKLDTDVSKDLQTRETQYQRTPQIGIEKGCATLCLMTMGFTRRNSR
jgi:hypothetical protein